MFAWAVFAYNWCWKAGVPGNIVASVIATGTAFVAGLAVGRRKLRVHLTRLEELHRLMHHVHAEKAAELGHTIPVAAISQPRKGE